MRADEYVKNVLLRPTDRDQQRKVGASNLSNACTRCLADDMAGKRREQGVFNMGAVVGTAIHEYLEHRNEDQDAKRELRVVIGEIEGYGPVKSTTDLYLPKEKKIVDFKTTTKNKLAVYRDIAGREPSKYETDIQRSSRATVEQYFRQAQMYALGVENMGLPVEQVEIVFIARDGGIVDQDIWSPPPVPYNPEAARLYLDRGAKIWQYISAGNDLEALSQFEHCYYCSVIRPTAIEEVEL